LNSRAAHKKIKKKVAFGATEPNNPQQKAKVEAVLNATVVKNCTGKKI